MKITIDPELKALIPALAADERRLLEESIKRDGVMSPLVLWERDGELVLIDGHNRFEIANAAGIAWDRVAPVLMSFECKSDAMIWMCENQLGRRNLSDLDSVLLVERKSHLIESRQGARTDLTSAKNLAEVNPSQHPRDQKADQAGVSKETYRAALVIEDAKQKGEIDPEVYQAVKAGKASVNRVHKDIKEKRQKAKREAKRDEAVAKACAPMPECLIVGDFREHAARVPNGSVSLIFTDPPYDRQASKMLPDLGKFAFDKLMDGGSLILYVGQTQIPAALDALRPHLRYWWTIACVHSGRSTVMREYGIKAGWKAVLWFVKGTRHDNSVMVNDTMSGGEEKTHHDWQQSQSEAEYWIGKLTAQDGIVCDPFLGGGTTAAAAQKLGRKWFGFEINEDSAKIIAERVSK